MGDRTAFQGAGKLFQEAALGTYQYRHPAVGNLLLDVEPGGFGGDPFRLLRLLVEDVEVHPARVGSGSDRTGHSGQLDSCGQAFGGPEDPGRDPERGTQHPPAHPVTAGSAEVLGESCHVGEFGAPERVYRLVRVGGGREVAVAFGESPQQRGLCQGGVLVLVHQEVPVLPADLLARRPVLHDLDGPVQQGAVVDAVEVLQRPVVAGDEPGKGSPVFPLGAPAPYLARVEHAFPDSQDELGDLLGQGPGGEQVLEGRGPGRDRIVRKQFGDQLDLFRTGEDGGHLVPAERIGCVQLQEPVGEGVERGSTHSAGEAARRRADTSVETGGGTSRERQGEDGRSRYAGFIDQVGHTAHQELGLARAGTGHHQLGSFRCGDGFGPVGRFEATFVELRVACRLGHATVPALRCPCPSGAGVSPEFRSRSGSGGKGRFGGLAGGSFHQGEPDPCFEQGTLGRREGIDLDGWFVSVVFHHAVQVIRGV